MNTTKIGRISVAVGAVVLAIGIGTAVVVADDEPRPGDEPIPVDIDGGIGDSPIPVDIDGGIGDTPGDAFAVEEARNEAQGLLGRYEDDLPADVRVGRRGTEHMAVTQDYRLGRLTVELDDDGDGYRVSTVVVELPAGPETFHLTPS